MSFEALKKNRQNLSDLVSAGRSATGRGGQNRDAYVDDRVWTPTRDAQGQGYAVIRFLPGRDPNATTPWVRYYEHRFQGPTGLWYIDKSLTSLGKTDPVAEMNSRLWNTGIDADKATARSRSRRTRFVTNILVVSDPAHPENNGQVRLFQFGTKIMGMILDKMEPPFPDEEPVNPFDMWAGADFVVKIRKVDGFPNYDTSTFKPAGPIPGGDELLESVYTKQYDLGEFLDPARYASYAELKAKLDRVLGTLGEATTVKDAVDLDDEVPAMASVPTAAAPDPAATADALKYFEQLAAKA